MLIRIIWALCTVLRRRRIRCRRPRRGGNCDAKALPLLVMMAAHVGAGPVDVACTNPAGNKADSFYNGDHHAYQFCNGTSWQWFAGNSFIQVSGGGSGCSNPAGHEAAVIYNQAYHTYQFCNGTYWIPYGQVQTPPVLPGYFVLSGGTYTGNLGGFPGPMPRVLPI